MGKIRILETIRQGQIGGGESHVLDLVSNLDKNLFEPVVLAFTDGPMIDQMKSMGIKSYVIPTLKPFDFRTWGKVKNLLKEEKIDIVHAHGTRANSNTFWAANSLNIPNVYTVHGWSFHPDQGLLKRKLRVDSERFLTKKVNLTICVSQANTSLGKELLGNYFDPTIERYGIDLKKFNSKKSFENLRSSFKASDDHVLLGAIIRMTKQKDPITLLKGFNRAIKENDKLRLVMVGDGELKQQCLDYVSQNNIGQFVHFENFRKDVPEILNAIDIYCLPSLWEGLPIGLLEAMAMNKAIIATQVDGTKEVLFDGVNGLKINPYDDEGLGKAILKMADKEFRVKLGSAARKTILEEYEVTKMTRNIESIYRRILNTK